MKKSVMGLLFISFLNLSGCGVNSNKSDLKFVNTNTPDFSEIKGEQANETDPKYLEIKSKLFDVSCIKCHNPKKTRRLDLTSKANILENFDDIIYRMTTAVDMGFDYMPPEGDLVKPELIAELQAWKSDIEFANLQKNLFAVSCLKCHGASQTKRYNLSSKTVIIEKFDEILYRMTDAFEENKKPMPPIGKGTKVSPELIKAFQDWKQSL